MGRQLMHKVTALTMAGSLPGLTDGARLVLLGMASTAHDTGRPPDTPEATYFGGWEYLAKGWLGYKEFDRVAERRVARAVNELVDAGLLIPQGRRGGRQGNRMYLLQVWL
jgi:hypothetical protein